MAVRTLVASLKRLYEKGKKNPGSTAVTIEKLKSMVEEGKITPAEYEYITGEPYDEKKKN